MIYVIGSLRNPEVPLVAASLRINTGEEVFDDWFASGPEADDKWREYEQARGHTYPEALGGLAAQHVFGFDLQHLNRSRAVVLVLPAGKSGHLELGYAIGAGKRGYILLDNPDRWDVMYQFATVSLTVEELSEQLVLHRGTVCATGGGESRTSNPIEQGIPHHVEMDRLGGEGFRSFYGPHGCG